MPTEYFEITEKSDDFYSYCYWKSLIIHTLKKVCIHFNMKVNEVICIYNIWNLLYKIMNFNMHQNVSKTDYFLDSIHRKQKIKILRVWKILFKWKIYEYLVRRDGWKWIERHSKCETNQFIWIPNPFRFFLDSS